MKLSQALASPEDLAYEVFVQANLHNEPEVKRLLDALRPSAENVLKNYHIPWDATAEELLKTACMRFDRYGRISFLDFFYLFCEQQYHLRDRHQTESESGYLYSEGVRGNGCGTFERTHTSSPERIALERIG